MVTGRMLVSRARRRFATIDAGRVARGAFYTDGSTWLTPQVLAFIRRARAGRILDPFAGDGHLLDAVAAHGSWALAGCDIEPRGRWTRHDSLRRLPPQPDTLILTNPPYLATYSARRKRVLHRVARYFAASPQHDDLYRIALDRCRAAARHVVAIVPETFLHSGYDLSELALLVVLERHPFSATACPACVACFDGVRKPPARVRLYKDETPAGTLGALLRHQLLPDGSLPLRFNAPDGALALRAVDSTDPARPLAFLPAAELRYDRARIRHSSRLITRIDLPTVPAPAVPALAARANALLARHRAVTHDLLLSPFKGNTKEGKRRRRLDYRTARALLERAALTLPAAGPRR